VDSSARSTTVRPAPVGGVAGTTVVRYCARIRHAAAHGRRRDSPIFNVPHASAVASIRADSPDSHSRRKVCALWSNLEDGLRVLYKPKDLRIDVAWQRLVERLNARASIDAFALHTPLPVTATGGLSLSSSRDVDQQEFASFFRRAGAWLALLHCFAVIYYASKT
jgi:lantibiotic modifying enzyme